MKLAGEGMIIISSRKIVKHCGVIPERQKHLRKSVINGFWQKPTIYCREFTTIKSFSLGSACQ
jgi:hypothetical protein